MEAANNSAFAIRHTHTGDVALRFNPEYEPTTPEADARLFVTPGSESATSIGDALTFYAHTIVEGRSAADLNEEEHVRLALIGIINTRLRGREYPTQQGRMEKGKLAATFSGDQTSLIFDAMRFALMARAATAADQQDSYIEEKQKLLDQSTAEVTSPPPYQLPEPPIMPIPHTPESRQRSAELQSQIAELTKARASEQITIRAQDGQIKMILGSLSIQSQLVPPST